MKHEDSSNTNCNRCVWYSHQMIGLGTRGLRNKRTSRDHPDYGKNTEKSSGGKETCHPNSSEKPSPNVGLKNSKKSKIIW